MDIAVASLKIHTHALSHSHIHTFNNAHASRTQTHHHRFDQVSITNHPRETRFRIADFDGYILGLISVGIRFLIWGYCRGGRRRRRDVLPYYVLIYTGPDRRTTLGAGDFNPCSYTVISVLKQKQTNKDDNHPMLESLTLLIKHRRR